MKRISIHHMSKRLLATYEGSSDADKAAGSAWYSVGKDACRDLSQRYQVSLECAAGVVAALSPRVTWRQNLKLANAVLSNSYERGAFKANLDKAFHIAYGASPEDILRGDKVRAFYFALIGRDTVVVDVWMLRAVKFARSVTKRAYRAIVEAIQRAAKAVNVAASAFQAIIWVTIRGSAS